MQFGLLRDYAVLFPVYMFGRAFLFKHGAGYSNGY